MRARTQLITRTRPAAERIAVIASDPPNQTIDPDQQPAENGDAPSDDQTTSDTSDPDPVPPAPAPDKPSKQRNTNRRAPATSNGEHS